MLSETRIVFTVLLLDSGACGGQAGRAGPEGRHVPLLSSGKELSIRM